MQNINLDKNYKPLIKIKVRDLMSELRKCDPIVRVRVLMYLYFFCLHEKLKKTVLHLLVEKDHQ